MGVASAAVQAQQSGNRLSMRDFNRLAQFVNEYSGIKLPASKHTMLEGRLRRRLRATGIQTFDEYCRYVFEEGGMESEFVHLVDTVTTNKTDFFREPKHFEYMLATVLPALVKDGVSRVRAWSAACSTGAEPYTMAMILDAFYEGRRDTSYSILATDLSTDVLEKAWRGIYPADQVEPVPTPMRKKYVMQAEDPARKEVRIVPKLRSKIGFARHNLMDSRYDVGVKMHIIFCRNVLIYFDKETQGKVLSRLSDCLVPGGYLFIGHSESIAGHDLPLDTVANTVFRRK